MNVKRVIFAALFLIGTLSLSAQSVFQNDEVNVTKVDAGVWVIDTKENVKMYIVEGDSRAVLIDTGQNTENLDAVVRKITTKPFDVLLTHNHFDHCGGVNAFGEVYLNLADTLVQFLNPVYGGTYKPLFDGQQFDLGGRTIEVVFTPGHTPGSVVFLDPSIGACFTGDSFGSGHVWLQLTPPLPMTTYLESCVNMERIMDAKQLTKIYCGHPPVKGAALGRAYLAQMRQLSEKIIAGDIADAVATGNHGMEIICDKPMMITLGDATIVFDSERIVD